MMLKEKKIARYERIYNQLKQLLATSPTFEAGLSTIIAVLYHKMPHFFWVGFYFLNHNKLTVGPYQGPLACQELEYPKGVCWKSVRDKTSIIVKDVHKFPDHIACDSRSKSEIVIPLISKDNGIIGVFDIDSDKLDAFDKEDEHALIKIMTLLKHESPGEIP